MKHKWLIATILIAVELVIGALIIASVNVPMPDLGTQFRFFQYDTVPAESTEEQRIAIGGATHLSVSNLRGQIAIASAPGDAIIIHAHKRAWSNTVANAQAALAQLDVNITQTNDTIEITRLTEEPWRPGIASMRRSPTVSLTITVPATMEVTARLDVGDVMLADTIGNADLRTNVGAVSVKNVVGDLQLYASTGNITVTNALVGALNTRTSNGAITFAGSLGTGPHTLESDHGNIRLSLPKDSTFAFDLQTDRGTIQSDLPLAFTSDLKSRKRGTLNHGGARLTINAHNGNIALMLLNP